MTEVNTTEVNQIGPKSTKIKLKIILASQLNSIVLIWLLIDLSWPHLTLLLSKSDQVLTKFIKLKISANTVFYIFDYFIYFIYQIN